MTYRTIREAGATMPSFDEVGLSVFSESNEDGILLYIYAMIGMGTRCVMDVGSGPVPKGSNSANLIVNHGWTGLLIDGQERNIQRAERFYGQCRATKNYPPTCVHTWVTPENINTLIVDNRFAGDVDLLCIDIDGIDYWLWKAIDCVKPRVVVVEYQCIWGPKESVTVPNDPQFETGFEGRFGVYCGASLAAFVKLGREKGYRLIGVQRYGYNGFFMRNDVGMDVFPEVSPEVCFTHPFTKWARAEFLDKVKERPWVAV
jgi:hypothetical protein